MPWLEWTLAFVLTGAASAAATWGVLRLLERRGVYDRPNERSSHQSPTPRGGGLAVVPVLLVAWILVALWQGGAPPGFAWVLGGTALLGVLSWVDDLHGLPVILRLGVHVAAVVLGLIGLSGAGPVFQGLLPVHLDFALAAVAWVWFLNLFNFMDGIDGISGIEAGSIGLGLALVGLAGSWPSEMVLPPLVAAAAALGFLVWNWAPAKVFLGDVGSVPLGYLLGWLLLIAAAKGFWAVALILPLYYLADASITLARRALHGERVWHSHREHFYQLAVQRGLSHSQVSARILVCNFALIALAVGSALRLPWLALGIAALPVGLLLWHFERGHITRAA